jgi:hypothetical protein
MQSTLQLRRPVPVFSTGEHNNIATALMDPIQQLILAIGAWVDKVFPENNFSQLASEVSNGIEKLVYFSGISFYKN